jgi:acetyl-CoA synthetase
MAETTKPEDPGAAFAWTPGERQIRRSRLLAALDRWGYQDLDELHRASLADSEQFWRDVVNDLDVSFRTPFTAAVDLSGGVQFPKWFVGGGINVADLCAHRHATGELADKEAVVYEGDSGARRSLTYAELDQQVRWFAGQLAALGVQRGDRVVFFAPVVPEVVVAFLACAAIGAVSVPAFTGYSGEALATRLQDSEAVLLVTADGTTRRGKEVSLKQTADEALQIAPGARTVVIRHLGNNAPMTEGRDIYWDEMGEAAAAVETVAVESNDPLIVVYTSGTTGRPKGIVHSHGGFAVKTAVDFAYGFDVHEDDVVGWITDMGWLVGPMMIVGVLQLGATAVLIEGTPDYPKPTRLFDLIDQNAITLQGVAPTAVRAIMSAGLSEFGDLSSLRAFASTGEAWDEPTWWWLYEEVGKRERPIINFSGGTEVGGGMLISYPFLPMHPASFTAPLPGLDPAVFDESGKPVVGQVGELVIRNASPGMTHSFWRDGERYLETYWNRWDGVWQHGDLVSVDGDGTWRIHGRSDDTIKVSGRRIGPAEIEASMLKDRRIAEAAAIGVPDERRGQRIVAFAVLRPDAGDVDIDELTKTAIANIGRSFAPVLYLVDGLPKTKNGKIMRRAIRSQHLGTPTGDMSSLDPETPLSAIPAAVTEGA